MKHTVGEISDLIDSRFYENTAQEILGINSNEMFIDIIDSYAIRKNPLQYFSFKIKEEDLDVDLEITFTHTLDTMDLKFVIYNHQNKRIYSPQVDFQPLTNSTAKFRFEGLPYNNYWKGYFYKIA